MKLKELNTSSNSNTLAKVYESHAGKKLNIKTLTVREAQIMLSKVKKTISEHNSTSDSYTRHTNPAYTKLMMLEQTLQSVVDENTMNAPVAIDVNDQATKTTIQKAERGQQLNPEEQKTMTAIALMKKEATKQKRMVKEDDAMQTAQVVLASQDIVDRIQKMIEEVSATQFKDLPALIDSIRTDIGPNEAIEYQSAANAALETLLGNIQNSKAGMEAAQAVLTGQEVLVPGLDIESDTDATVDSEVDDIDLDVDQLDINTDDVETEVEVDSDEEIEVAALGREKRA